MSVPTDPSPALSNRSPLPPRRTFERSQSQQIASALDVDLSLPTAISHLVNHLLLPLTSLYPASTLSTLRQELCSRLEQLFAPTWEEPHPQHGSGYRSLICSRQLGLPLVLKEAAKRAGVEADSWKKALSSGKGRKDDEEWEAWCDPGAVYWRYGGWEWEDVGFEPVKLVREPVQTVWQGGASEFAPLATSQQAITPIRPSYAIPIRAPTVFAIPPTPAPPPTRVVFPPSPLDDAGRPRPSSSVFGPLSLHSGTESNEHVPSALVMQSELGLGPAPFFQRSTSPSISDASSLASAFSLGGQSRSVTGSSIESAESSESQAHGYTRANVTRGNHRGSESLSSVASSASESNSGHTQLLTPASRPGSADPFNVNVPPLTMRDTHNDKDRADREKEREREHVRMRKITPPMLALRGRTPSPGTPDNLSTTPGTETTITPNSALPPTPSVTPYDGGNVTVLGGGVKLGGASNAGSRSVSAMSHRSTSGGNGIDRSRSPSVSLASRALSTALGPNANCSTDGEGAPITSSRKQRTRRRIMPTYLGHLGQPGVGGPIMGVFGQFAGKSQGPPAPPGIGSYVPHVGVGMAPPPVGPHAVGTRPVSLGSQRMP